MERTNRNTGEHFMGCNEYRSGCRYTTQVVAATITDATGASNDVVGFDRFIAQAEREVECNCSNGIFGSHIGRNDYSARCLVIARAEELESDSFVVVATNDTDDTIYI